MKKKQSLIDTLVQFNKASEEIDAFKSFKTIKFDTKDTINEDEITKSFNCISKFINSYSTHLSNTTDSVDVNILKYYLTNFENKLQFNACNSFFKPLNLNKCTSRDLINLMNLDI